MPDDRPFDLLESVVLNGPGIVLGIILAVSIIIALEEAFGPIK